MDFSHCAFCGTPWHPSSGMLVGSPVEFPACSRCFRELVEQMKESQSREIRISTKAREAYKSVPKKQRGKSPWISFYEFADTSIGAKRRNPEDLGEVEVVENDNFFASGVPVTFPFMHSTDSAPYLGSKFGQDIEPAGFYLLFDTSNSAAHPAPGWEYGEISFDSPLVLAMTTTDDPMEPVYGPNGWKARLHDAYGLTGVDLSLALLADGYDAVVTAWMQNGNVAGTREIVDLRVVEE